MPTHTQCLHLVNSHYGSQSGSVKTQVRSRHSSGILQGHPTSLSAKSEVLTMAYKAHHDLLPIPAQFCLPLIHPRPIDLISVPGTHQAHSCSRTSVIALCLECSSSRYLPASPSNVSFSVRPSLTTQCTIQTPHPPQYFLFPFLYFSP